MKIEVKCTVVDVTVSNYLDPTTGKPVQKIRLNLNYPNAPVGEKPQGQGDLVVIAPGDEDMGKCEPGDTYVLHFYN